MDMMAFDGRKKAEQGIFEPLRHPYTGKPFSTGKDAPGFYVRGLAARSVQSRLADMQRKAKTAVESGDDETAAMERLHEALIEDALKYIIRADDAMEYDGALVGDDPDLIRKVLDSTFPEMRTVKDADGNVVTQKARVPVTDDEGKETGEKEEIDVPKFEMANEPFAQQIGNAAKDGSLFFGKTSKG